MSAPAGPAYRIVTQRLVLRCWDPRDAPLLKASIDENLEHLRPWMPWAHDEPQTIEQKIELLRRFRSQFDRDEDYPYAIFNPDESRVLGGTGLHKRSETGLEIGYWVHAAFTRQGLATEASAALTRAAFEIHRVRRLEIVCAPENLSSAAVPRKLGFTLEATLRGRAERPNGFNDSMIWALLADEFPSSPAASAAVEAYDAQDARIL